MNRTTTATTYTENESVNTSYIEEKHNGKASDSFQSGTLEDRGATPWSQRISDLERELGTSSKSGLTKQDAKARLAKDGENLLEEPKGVSAVKVLIAQTCNAMVLVLLIAMIISLAIRDWISGGCIGGVVGINVVVGFFQEYSAQKTMASLQSMSSPTARVIREGDEETIPSKDLVVGDLITLKVGETIPADCRLVSGMNFETEEALLTGESLPVVKEYTPISQPDLPVGDRINMAFASSTVSKGRATAIVTATGMATEIGQIAQSLNGESSHFRKVKRDEEGNARKRDYFHAFGGSVKDVVGNFLGINEGTPLHRLMSRLAIYLFFVAVIIAIVSMAAQEFNVTREVAIYAIVAALAMIPASMVVVLTITMAVGTKSMVERNVMIRKLDSLEALGSVNDICSDKTGTLTQGKMIVRRVWIPSYDTASISESTESYNPTVGRITMEDGEVITEVPKDERFQDFMYTASMANIAEVHETSDGVWKATGDPTEIAIQVFVTRLNWQRDLWVGADDGAPHDKIFNHLAEYPFDSSIKRMTAIYEHRASGKINVYTKGATERILGLCSHWYGDEHTDNPERISFTNKDHEVIFEKVEELAKEGLRVLAFATKTLEKGSGTDWHNKHRDEVENDLCLLGLVGIYDPPRLESAPAVALAHHAGINVHMLTGDHPATATAIAKEVGIVPKDLHRYNPEVVSAMIMTATQFDALSDEEVDKLPVLPLVIARCAPKTKVRMIEALHRRDAFTAMTGDGVNDSPSLKKADVGIAMGIAGSDVAKSAADIVLSDDNFASILNAVEEGRRMTDNIQRFVLHLLAGNVSQVLFLLIGLAFKDNDNFSVFPMSPVEVLWIIMITSSFPAMGLGQERADPDIMDKPPKDPKSAVFTWEVIVDMVVYGFFLACICVATFVGLIYGYGDGKARLGHNCNENYSDACYYVYRTRSVTFVQMTWALLVLAWEMIDMRRSLFNMTPGKGNKAKQLFDDLWRNQLLFWSVIGGFVTVFPVIYIPVINKSVFKHKPMKWEWGLAFAGLAVFILLVELWKWAKRVYYRKFTDFYKVKDPQAALEKPFS